MIKTRMTVTLISVAAGVVLVGCTPMHSRPSFSARRASLSPAAFALNWSLGSKVAKDAARLELGSDQTVGVAGFLGQTVNEVVPIPGTDMVRAGALQEGSLFQSSFRSPQQEGAILSEAIIIFRISRPVRSW